MNRNFGPSQMEGQMRSLNRVPNMNKNIPYPAQSNQGTPYPTQPLMPQPNLNIGKTEIMPPCYSEAVKN